MIRILLVSLFFVLTISQSALALKSDTSKPIHISSDTQSVDMQKNTITFSGNVVINQGTIAITANKVIIHGTNSERSADYIEGFGQPVRFSQQQEDGSIVKGHSDNLNYNLKNQRLVLTSNVYFEQRNSSTKGDMITYQVKEQQMVASSQGKSQVITIINPADHAK